MDRNDFNRYITENEKNLTRLCIKLCRNHSDAEDLYQETWCKVVDKIHQYDKSKPFQPWLFTVCINTYRNAYKKARKMPIAQFNSNEEMEYAINNAVNPKSAFDEEHDLIKQVIDSLDEKHRTAVILHYFGDYSIEQLASIIGVPQGTVKSRLHKARKIIRGRLAENDL
jgi:RNA polymerase sigma-70 factor (ECF subfamily)